MKYWYPFFATIIVSFLFLTIIRSSENSIASTRIFYSDQNTLLRNQIDSLSKLIVDSNAKLNKKVAYNKESILFQRIELLQNQIQNESSEYKSQLQTDIDRLSMYLGVGFAVLAIFGGLLPVLIGNAERKQIDRRLEKIENETKTFQESYEKADRELEKILTHIPQVKLLTFQNSINRLFHFSNIKTYSLPSSERNSHFVKIFRSIKSSLMDCLAQENKSIIENTNFKEILLEFALGVNVMSVQSVLGINDLNKPFEKLGEHIYGICNCQISEANKYIGVIEAEFDTIIEIITGQNNTVLQDDANL